MVWFNVIGDIITSYKPLPLFIFLAALIGMSSLGLAVVLDPLVFAAASSLGITLTFAGFVVLVFLSLPVTFILKYGKHGR